ncbi:MAG TPA: transcriptional regulator [Arsenophonus apicola]|uniref:transcriptional regulator n=1 Tax=Arsenophonus TaxID=637 RepID=UPI0015D76CD3|nr:MULTISPECIES: helix-turn-helix domain-containing protein [Arsenophonus]UBX30200.1 helix-turn-helix domain-containing protein [Arsenophonus apicola]
MNLVIKKAIGIVGGQRKLAEICGVSQPAVHKWLKGEKISPERVMTIVNATDGLIKAYELWPDLPMLFPMKK